MISRVTNLYHILLKLWDCWFVLICVICVIYENVLEILELECIISVRVSRYCVHDSCG